MAVNTRVPNDMTFGQRGVQTRDEFVVTQEAGQDKLSGEFSTKINAMANEFNSTANDVNLDKTASESARDNAQISAQNAFTDAQRAELAAMNTSILDAYNMDASDTRSTAMSKATFNAIARDNRDKFAGSGAITLGGIL